MNTIDLELVKLVTERPEVVTTQQWEQIIERVLIPASDEYYNGSNDSTLSDATYDALSSWAERHLPYHAFFTGVGATVRGGKIDLPFQMGSLDQVHIGDLKKWVNKVRSTVGDCKVIVSAKLDGASGCVIWDNDHLRISYSRGNGIQGADTTRHTKHFVTGVKTPGTVAVRGEVIISKPRFNALLSSGVVKASTGKPYRNPRNCVSGIMNAESNVPAAYTYVDFVAYSDLDSKVDKFTQLSDLQFAGFKVPEFIIMDLSSLTEKALADYIDYLRRDYEYEVDGVVVEINDAAARAKLDGGALNPEYAFKYKTQSDENFATTTVCGVEWNVSKDGYLKPRVILEPCSLPGITCTYATGYNAAYIEDNKIGPGTVVVVSRMGDVVPNIVQVKKSTKPDFPDVSYKWNDTRVDIISTDTNHHNTILIKCLVDVATKLEVSGLRLGTATAVIESNKAGYNNISEVISDIVRWPVTWWTGLVGSNGEKIHDSLHQRLNGITVGRMLGAMPHFGRGVGRKKMAELISQLKIVNVDDLTSLTTDKITRLEGFDEKTARKILVGIPQFTEMWSEIRDYVVFKDQSASGNKLAGEKICMTGFRDGVMERFIEDNGGDVQSGVSAKTTILVVAELSNSPSGKLKKALDLNASKGTGIKIVTAVDFKSTYMDAEKQVANGIEF